MEAFNLERQTALENSMDPTGKQWVIHGKKGSALVHARPNPDRSDAQIPQEFQGQWTSPTVLREKLDRWLNKQWDISDEAVRKNLQKRARLAATTKEQEAQKKQTPEQSLAELDPEIAAELGDIIAIEEEATPKAAPKKAAAKKAPAKKKKK